jgi:hypothetical protein
MGNCKTFARESELISISIFSDVRINFSILIQHKNRVYMVQFLAGINLLILNEKEN